MSYTNNTNNTNNTNDANNIIEKRGKQYTAAEIQNREVMKKKNSARNDLFNETTYKFKKMANQLHLIFSTSTFDNKDARIIAREHIFGFVHEYGKAYSNYYYSTDRFSAPEAVDNVMNLVVQMDDEINDELMKLNIGDVNKNNYDNLVVRLQQALYQDHQTNQNMPDDLETLIDFIIDEYHVSTQSVIDSQNKINEFGRLTKQKFIELNNEIASLRNNDLASDFDVAKVQIQQLQDEIAKKDKEISQFRRTVKNAENKINRQQHEVDKLVNVNEYYKNQIANLQAQINRSNISPSVTTPVPVPFANDIPQLSDRKQKQKQNRNYRRERENENGSSIASCSNLNLADGTATAAAPPAINSNKKYARPNSFVVNNNAFDSLDDVMN